MRVLNHYHVTSSRLTSSRSWRAGVSRGTLTRTRVVPVSSPGGRGNSSVPGIVSVLLPCVTRPDAVRNVVEEGKDDVVVRNSTYRFSEDDDEPTDESRRPTPQHRLNAHPDTFQTAGSNVRLISKAKENKRRARSDRRRTSDKKDGKDSSDPSNCQAEPSVSRTTAARKWIPFLRRHHQRQRRRDPEGQGQSNSTDGQI